MASSTSSDLKLELITTGEKSGTWGTITNTNLQILEQAASGYIAVDVASSDIALALSNHAVSNGKNLYSTRAMVRAPISYLYKPSLLLHLHILK